MDKVTDKLKGLANTIEKFVEENFVEKKQRDQNLKKLSLAVEGFVKENISQRQQSPRKVLVKTLDNFEGELPKYETKNASGMDVRAQLKDDVMLEPGDHTLISTGLSFEIPAGYEIQVRPRSGWALKEGVTVLNTPGTIDADYRGELKVILINLGKRVVKIENQMRVAQLVLCPVINCHWQEVDKLQESTRGDGGFGSTGKQA